MIYLRNDIAHQKINPRMGGRSDPMEYQCLMQIEQRLYDLKEDLECFVMFNPQTRMEEL